jgi:hypothetical protein
MTHEDALWALHSESKEVCLQTVISQCPKELILWNDVRQNKISYWIDDVQMVRSAGQDKFKVFFNVFHDIRRLWRKALLEITS